MEFPLHSTSAIKAIHQLIEYQAIHNPNMPALEFHGEILTYKLLNTKSNKLAHFLISKGVSAETVVGISVKRSLNMVIGILAIWKAGGAYLPIDPDYPTHRIEYIFNDSSIQLLLTEKSLLEHLPHIAIKKICFDEELFFESFSEHNPACFLAQENLAYLLYTSGSTGNPKGVMVTHENLIATYLSWKKIYNLTSEDCHLQMASFSFDVFAGDLLRALCSGAKLVLCSKINLLRPENLYNLMIDQGVNCAEFVPTILRRLINYIKSQKKSFYFMRLLLCGSDSWTLGEYRNLKQICGNQTRVINSYGLTEASIDSTWFEENLDFSTSLSLNQYVPIGKPFPHTQIFLLDEQLNEVGDEAVGEIYIGGLGIARGYYNKPDLNKERYIEHSFNGNFPIKLYKTGDQGRFLSDGNIQFLGRKDNQIKLRGIRIELSEIEFAINNFPSIKENIVILNEQEPSHPRLVAYVITEQKSKEILSELRHFLIENLPGYLIPATFIPLDELPLTPNGKIDRENLKNRQVVFHS